MKPAESTAAPEEFGPYIVYERLGVGGMATVHRAKKRGIAGFERGVALKRMLPHLAEDAEFINSFVREAKLASMLVHPNIAQIYDFGRVGSVYFIAMEHVDGFDVRKMLRYSNRHKEPLPLNVVMSILTELCDALEYAHTFVDEHGQPQGIVHRDVSPSNLIVAQSGHLKVIDFGIAKANARQLHTESGRVKGKLGYMSPEAVSGRSFGPVSDVFSAGVVAHELLTAHPLFSAKTDYDTLIRIHEAEIPPPSRRNPSVPAALDDLVLAALARDPERRLQTAGAFRQGLDYVAEQAGIRFSARDVAEWRARIATTEDPWGSRTSLPNVSSSAVSRAFPFPESRSLSSGAQRALSDTGRVGSHEPRLARNSGAMDASSDEEKVADLTWGADGNQPSSHPIPDHDVQPAVSPSAVVPPPTIGASLQAQRRNPTGRFALIGLFAIAAGLAVYQFVLRTPKRPPPAAPAPVASSIKFLITPPDSLVEIGGKEAGRHAPFEYPVEPGVYSVRVRHDGYKSVTTEVTVREGKTSNVEVALEPGKAHLIVNSQTPGLTAELDGKPIDQQTPFEIQVPAGQHTLVVSNAAGATWSQSFTAEVDQKYSYVAPLGQAKKTSTASAASPTPAARTAPQATERNERSERGKHTGSGSQARISTGKDTSEPEVRAPEPVAPPPAQPAPPVLKPDAGVTAPTPEPGKIKPAPATPSGPKSIPVVAATAVTKLSGEIPAIKANVTDAYTDVVAKICIDERGQVTSVKIIKALPEIADELQRSLSAWRYKPYVGPAGQPSPACFAVTFRVVFKRSN